MPATHGLNYAGGTTQGHVSNLSPKTNAPIAPATNSNVTVSSAAEGMAGNTQITSSGKKNVLNKYRSFSYIFTLSALSPDDADNPSSYRSNALKYIVLKSGGKGTGTDTGSDNASSSVSDTVGGFNQNSPGRFDMFIDNIEIQTIMEFNTTTGTTQPTHITFDVFEPYSINGFLEALYVTALAAGWKTQLLASYLLKIEFIGYTDDEVSPSSQTSQVDNSSRYFTIVFSGVEVEVTEKGTKYKCNCVPIEQIAYGQTNRLKEQVKASGTTVKAMLNNFMNNLNEQIVIRDNKAYEGKKAPGHDEYKIKFQSIDSSAGFKDDDNSLIATTKIIKPNKDVKLSGMEAPEKTTKPNNYQLSGQSTQTPQQETANPSSVTFPANGDPTAIFPENTVIHENIASVIRDSEYVRKLLKDLNDNTSGVKDENDMVNYFLVRVEKTNQKTINPQTNLPYQTYTYIVSPYKIHYYKVPGYYNQNINTQKIISLREYNYIYTGNNIDVLNFKLEFNNLYFEAYTRAMGNSDEIPANNTGGPTKSNDANIKSGSTGSDKNQLPSPQKLIGNKSNDVNQAGGNANQPSEDAYYKLARNMHDAIVDSHSSMITGEIDILGDPFYLVTGGIGNNNPKPVPGNGAITSVGDGEAPYNYGQVFINIKFNNPIDISSNTGQMIFDQKKVPFSGIYSVTTVNSIFKEGKFTQKLNIIRAAGKTQDEKNAQSPQIANIFVSSPKLGDQLVPDTSRATALAIRPSTINSIIQSGRGLPNPGLPGQASNFTNAAGGLGGSTSPSNLLPQVSGAVTPGTGVATAGANLFGGTIPNGTNQLATGIRMQASGLSTLLSQTASGTAVSNNSVIAVGSSNINPASNLISVQGSGIGQGASVIINNTSPSIPRGTQVYSDLQSQTAVIPPNISGLVNKAANAVNAAIPLSGSAKVFENKIVTDINKISSLIPSAQNSPNRLASALGINISQLSGLSPNLNSKLLGQISAAANLLPPNTNIRNLTAQGVDLNTVPVNNFGNLPATPPYSIAPPPAVNTQFLNNIVASEGPTGLANVYGVSDPSKIPASVLPTNEAQNLLAQTTMGITNPFNQITKTIQGVTPLTGATLKTVNQVSSDLNGLSNINNVFNNKVTSLSPLVKLLTR
jgi:hypothetical protein